MSAFGAAFKAARSAGKKTFTFGGKSYTTKLKGEDSSSAPAKSVRPTARATPAAPTTQSARARRARLTARAPAPKAQAGAPTTSPRPSARPSRAAADNDYFTQKGNTGSRGRASRRNRPAIRG